MYLCVYIESGNLDVCFAMTSALAGRGFVAMLRGMWGAVSVALRSAASCNFLATIESSMGFKCSLVVFSMIGFATHSFVCFGNTTLYLSSPSFSPLETVACCLPVLALWSRAANCVRATMPLHEKCCRLERYFSCTLWYTSSVPVWQFSVNCSMSLRRVLSKTTSLRASCAGEPGRSHRFVLASSLGMGGWGHSWYKSALSHEWMLAEWWTMEIHFSHKRFLSPSEVSEHHQRWLETDLIQGKSSLHSFLLAFSVSLLVILFATCQTSN